MTLKKGETIMEEVDSPCARVAHPYKSCSVILEGTGEAEDPYR